jgi:CheY-like chemotaxis protein
MKPPPRILVVRVLVVDDNPVNREVARGILEYLGHPFDVASGWRDALDLLNRASYSLILMDCEMPEMDGYQLTRLIRETGVLEPRVPIVAMTAHSSSESRAKCLSAGMDDYLAKPIQAAALKSLIGRWLGNALGNAQETAQPAAASSTVSPASASFDVDDLIDRLMGNENLARRAAARFLEETPRQLLALSAALGAQDAESAHRHAHSIKGAAANVSAAPVRDLAAELEQLGHEARLDDAARLLPTLSSAFDALRPAIERFSAKR